MLMFKWLGLTWIISFKVFVKLYILLLNILKWFILFQILICVNLYLKWINIKIFFIYWNLNMNSILLGIISDFRWRILIKIWWINAWKFVIHFLFLNKNIFSLVYILNFFIITIYGLMFILLFNMLIRFLFKVSSLMAFLGWVYFSQLV